MEKLKDKVIQWAEDKGIFAKSDPTSQFLKTISEVGELADAVNKNDLPEIKDAIGDIVVTLILLAKMCKINYLFGTANGSSFPEKNIKKDFIASFFEIALIAEEIYNDNQPSRLNFRAIDSCLKDIAKYYGWTLQECLQSAYDVISKRTGKMQNGVFVKDVND